MPEESKLKKKVEKVSIKYKKLNIHKTILNFLSHFILSMMIQNKKFVNKKIIVDRKYFLL